MKAKAAAASALLVIILLGASLIYILNRPDRKYVRVEVLNGSGIQSAGRKTAELLRAMHNDVICVSDAPTDTISETIIVERTRKNKMHARRIASLLKCGNIFCVIDSSLYVDVTVVVGKDYTKYIKEH